MSDEDRSDGSVEARVELTGDYERIAEIIGEREPEREAFETIAGDMDAVIEIVTRTGGATKSRIVDELPSTVTADLDADAVIHVLRVLEMYDLVDLDGNTWRPGAALPQS